jgi:hypothetical protein
MGIIAWIFLGLFAGLIARALVPGPHRARRLLRAPPRSASSAPDRAGFIASALDIGHIDDFFDLGTWLIAIGGS